MLRSLFFLTLYTYAQFCAVNSANNATNTNTSSSAAVVAHLSGIDAHTSPVPTLNYSSSANFSIKRNYSTTAAGGVAVLIPPQLKTSNSYSLAENVNDPSTNAPMISAPENSDFYQELLLKYNNNNNNSVNINWKQFPNDQYNYNDYVSQIQLSCQQKLHDGVFDVVWMNATTAGFLSDCLVDLWEYDADITAGHDPTIAWNGVVKQRLVTLPAENDFGVLYYNNELLKARGLDGSTVSTFKDLEAVLDQFNSLSEGSMTYAPYASGFVGESLVAGLVELFAAVNDSTIIDGYGNVTVANTKIGDTIMRLIDWSQAFLIDPLDFVNSDDQSAMKRWIGQQAVFLRHWSAANSFIQNSAAFSYSVAPIPSLDRIEKVGAFNGWSVGVYKYSTNIPAAVKAAKYLTSKEFQKSVIMGAPSPILPTYPSLFDDNDVQGIIGFTSCRIFKSITPHLRPSTVVGAVYNNASTLISSIFSQALNQQINVSYALQTLDVKLRTLLGQALGNSSGVTLDDSLTGGNVITKKVPKNVGTQSLILAAVIACSVTAAVTYRRHVIKKAETRDSKTAAGGQGGPETKNEANTDGGGGDVKMPEMVKIEMVGTNRIGKEKYDDASSPLVVKSDGLTSHYTNEYDAFSPSAPLVSKSAIK